MAKIPKCGRLSRPALWSIFGRTIKPLDFTFYFFYWICKRAIAPGPCQREQILQNNTIIVALVLLFNAKTVGAFLKTFYLG